MKKLNLLIILFCVCLYSCKDKSLNKNKNLKPSFKISNNSNYNELDSIEISNLNDLLHKTLVDEDFYYSFRDSFEKIIDINHFRLSDYGYPYNPNRDKDNKLGNAEIFLLPRKFIKKKFSLDSSSKGKNRTSKIDSFEKYVNQLSSKGIKKEFHIYIILLSEEYLKYDKSRDIYIPKDSYKLKFFEFDNYWKLIGSTEMITNNDESEIITTILTEKFMSIR